MKDGAFKALKVLVVDDEVFAQDLVVRVLEQLGVGSVAAAGSGTQALEFLAAGGKAFGLVISDIMMPEMSGFELVRRIRYGVVSRYKDMPILMLTGDSTEKTVLKSRMYRIQGFIAKPPDPETLKRHIKRALGKK